MKKNLFCLIALVAVFALVLAGCGSNKAEETTAAPAETVAAAQAQGLADWSLTATTWSSPNGATINLTATPSDYTDGQSAAFVVRLDGEEVENIPCDWNGSTYTASAELNGADGYCYYVVLTTADGAQSEIAVNTPDAPVDDALINMASSLNAYCTLTVTEASQDGDKLTITDGSVQVQLPLITNEGESIVCDKAVLVMTLEGSEVSSTELDIGEPSDTGAYNLSIAGTEFKIPSMEDNQRVELRLDVTLSNNQTLTALGGSWLYNGGNLLLAVG